MRTPGQHPDPRLAARDGLAEDVAADDAVLEENLAGVRARSAGPVEGVFGPSSVCWGFYRESVLLVGGMRALLLQLAHPQVAAGVASHSDFARDPYRRVFRTFDLTYRIVFGDLTTAFDTARRIHRRHHAVRGVGESGRRYRANDPSLLLWVHATLIDTALRVHEQIFGPLDAATERRLHEESRLAAALFGIQPDAFPRDPDAFRHYFASMIEGDELLVSDTARRLGRALLAPPPMLRALSVLSRRLTPGLLPPRLRLAYGLPFGDAERRTHERLIAILRRTVPRLPEAVRFVPFYHQARARLARHRGQRQPLEAHVLRALYRIGQRGLASHA